jgi:hypothetical protein
VAKQLRLSVQKLLEIPQTQPGLHNVTYEPVPGDEFPGQTMFLATNLPGLAAEILLAVHLDHPILNRVVEHADGCRDLFAKLQAGVPITAADVILCSSCSAKLSHERRRAAAGVEAEGRTVG